MTKAVLKDPATMQPVRNRIALKDATSFMNADAVPNTASRNRARINVRWRPNLNRMNILDDVIKWKHFPRYWAFVRGIHLSLVNTHHKGQWRRALMLSVICSWTNSWANNGDAYDCRRHRAHYDVAVMNALRPKTHSCICTSKWTNNWFKKSTGHLGTNFQRNWKIKIKIQQFSFK